MTCIAVNIFTLNYISLELLFSQFMCTQKTKRQIIVFLFTFLNAAVISFFFLVYVFKWGMNNRYKNKGTVNSLQNSGGYILALLIVS